MRARAAPARHSRGPGARSNKVTTSELGLNAAVLSALRVHLASPAVEAWVAEVVASRAGERQAPSLASEVAAAEARVEKVADALARIGYSETLARRLRNVEAKLLDLRAQLVRAAPDSRIRATLQLKHETAALASGGRLSAESTGCGGRI